MNKIAKFFKENLKIIIPIAIIAVPVTIFLVILIVAALKSGTVIVGKRYRNDLNPSIQKAQIEEVKSSITSLSNVDSVEINLETSQFRVLIDAKDSITDEEAQALCKSVYDKVNSTLPVSTYFTKDSQGQKMYDLEITVFNDLSSSDLIIYTIVKNSTMTEYQLNNPSSPKDPELVEELHLKEEERKNPTTDTPETTPQFEEKLEDDDNEDIEASAE